MTEGPSESSPFQGVVEAILSSCLSEASPGWSALPHPEKPVVSFPYKLPGLKYLIVLLPFIPSILQDARRKL